MEIMDIKDNVGGNKRKLVYVQKQPPQVFSVDCTLVNYISTVNINPQITGINPLQVVPAERTGL
jgi:hypothetical protein